MATNQPARPAARPAPDHPNPELGAALAVAAYLIWGTFPLFFKLLAHMPPLEVLAHRTVWTLVFVLLVMLAMGRREMFTRQFYRPATLGIMAVSALAIAVNWGAFIAAVAWGEVLQSSLGYFMSPFFSVVLGIIVLGERPRPLGWLAIFIALAAVAYMLAGYGQVPWLALTLAGSWGMYGLAKKKAPLGPLAGLFMETLLLAPLGLAYVAHIEATGGGVFGASAADALLLMGAGAVTALPLLLFARAARMLRLTSIGVLQYVVPSGHFMLAVFVFNEPFGQTQLVTFGLIWLALGVYVFDAVRGARGSKEHQ